MELIDAEAVFDALEERFEALTRWFETGREFTAPEIPGLPEWYLDFPEMVALLARTIATQVTSPGLRRATTALARAADVAASHAA